MSTINYDADGFIMSFSAPERACDKPGYKAHQTDWSKHAGARAPKPDYSQPERRSDGPLAWE